ncbi:MAG TPA: ASPIC/UnbV domain-containing protein, partial [Vicinamibacteria bacterium]|nr:ASPIC/UnbV domain-containing protein [Vicinamibacteria bacterium]
TPQLLQNVLAPTGNWLLVKLRGKGRNRSAVGALVVVHAKERVQRRLVQSGTSYISQDDKRQHFGLGAAETVETIEVLWSEGTVTTKENLPVNRLVEIEQAGS